VFGAGHVCCTGPANQIPPGTTVLKGLQASDPNVTYAQDQATAVSDAASADAVVVAVGEKAYAEGLGDNPAPQLPPDQKALISALEATGKPVIVVVIAGRPLGLGPAESADGLLMAYQGSTEVGAAVADVIFGKVDPSGHLPVTWPSDAAAPGGDFNSGAPSPLGDEPKFFDQLPGTNSGQGSGYNPLYPFGYGLSYTTFQTSALSAPGSVSSNGSVTATFTVTNTRWPGWHRRRAGVRAPADQRCPCPRPAAGGIHPGDAGSRPVQDRPGNLPRLRTGGDTR
jgi:beta-glucosidase